MAEEKESSALWRFDIMDKLLPSEGQSFVTRSRTFNKFIDWAFELCKPDEHGQITEPNLYSGLLLLHITLARYIGPVACFPPSRDVVAKIFAARDLNNSGGISREEFLSIVKSFITQMTGRMATYVLILVMVVPRIVRLIMMYFDIDHDSYTELVAHQSISFGVFISIVNFLWRGIDETASANANKERARALELNFKDDGGTCEASKKNE